MKKKSVSLILMFVMILALAPVASPAQASTPRILPGVTLKLPGATNVQVTITDVYESYQRGSSNSDYPQVANTSIFDVSNTGTVKLDRAVYIEWSANNGISWFPAKLINAGGTIRFSDPEYANQRAGLFRIMLGTTDVGNGVSVANEAYFRFYNASANPPRGVTVRGSGSISELAVTPEMIDAANKLHTLGLFQGIGSNPDGSPNFDLVRAPTRAEAITMFVRLLGKDSVAINGTWSTPFTDVDNWARPYVGYAYANGLTQGTSATTFGRSDATVSQYLTFILRALSYTSGTDFQWDRAWELSDRLGITAGEYNASAPAFIRGHVAIVSFSALSARDKDTGKALYEQLIEDGAITREAANSVGLGG